VRDVAVRVICIGQFDLGKRRLDAGNDLLRLRALLQKFAAQLGKADVAPAGYHVIGQAHDLLLIAFVTDLRPAQHHGDVRGHAFEQGDHASDLAHVPDVNAETDDARLRRQQSLDDLLSPVLQSELHDLRVTLQLAHVGGEIAQAQRSMDVARVERSEDDGGHAGQAYRKSDMLREFSEKALNGAASCRL